MPTLSQSEIAALLQPYLVPAQPASPHAATALGQPLLQSLSDYLEILLKWNARTNLTAIRGPQEIVQRHFGESLFAAQHLAPTGTLLDFGSGAGFPGLPIQLLHPARQVTLAESQHKKSAFLREAVRTLQLPTQVWAARVEQMPPAQRFDTVTLRAVDDMAAALAAARARVAAGGQLAVLTTRALAPAGSDLHALPLSDAGVLALLRLD
ncbi:MAG: 16S rRNA (guanine(527)-N(7))-methyltransferase RsmG [Acidobacteriota bacterium]|nr:16S rRNA (guanine(527)-N(7))-methyltransferase RsmG [Acidobacteriota bacterium]